jgi:hypothetical protein
MVPKVYKYSYIAKKHKSKRFVLGFNWAGMTSLRSTRNLIEAAFHTKSVYRQWKQKNG